MAIDNSLLTNYVNEQREPVTKNIIFGAPSTKLLSIMPKCKGDQALNIIKTDVVFGDGATCGWSDDSSANMSQRILRTADLKLNIAYCQRQLSKYWAGEELNKKIGIEKLPFEEKFVADAVSNACKKIDNMIWYGDSTNPQEFDGLVTIAAADAEEASPSVHVVDASATLDGDLYLKLQTVIETIPDEVYNDSIVVMSVETFRGVINSYNTANPYKTLEFVSDDKLCFRAPDTNVLVYGLAGMRKENSKDMLAYNPKTAFYGIDYEDSLDTFKFRFDDHLDQFELHMLMNPGTQFAFLDEVVYAPTAE